MIYRELIVGAGSTGRFGLPRDAYLDPISKTILDPDWWHGQLDNQWGEDGIIVRYPFGIDTTNIAGNESRYDMPAVMFSEGEHQWIQSALNECSRAADAGVRVLSYHGKQGIGAFDYWGDGLVYGMPGQSIIDASNGSERSMLFRRRLDYAEPFPDGTQPHHGDEAGSYCFAVNIYGREGGYDRLAYTRKLMKERPDYEAIISFPRDWPDDPSKVRPDRDWLLDNNDVGVGLFRENMPNWKALVGAGFSLAFRGDREKVDEFTAGRLDEMLEMAKEARDG